MIKRIPLNSLVITVAANPAAWEGCVSLIFPKHEVISADGVRHDLVGDVKRREIDAVVFAEIHHRAEVKLRLGERVVVHAANLRRDGRMALAKIGQTFGVPVFYLVLPVEGEDSACWPPIPTSDHARQRFYAAEKDILRGDGVAEVVDMRDQEINAVAKLPLCDGAVTPQGLLELRSQFRGLTVVGDVHGMHQSLLSTVDWARARNHFLVFLGDVIDYGQGSLDAADEVYRLVTRGRAELIVGNHERKIAKWIDQSDRGRQMMRLSEGNRVTTQALQALGDTARGRWMNRFRGLVARSHLHLTFGDVVMTHGAIHPSFWSEPDYRAIETAAQFGEVDLKASTGQDRPTRTYNWVQSIPAGTTVVVGHDARSTTYKPLEEINGQGGRAFFMDTGSGKGGRLSSLDLRFTDTGLKLENFNTH